MSEGLPGYSEDEVRPDVQILVNYYWNENTEEWTLNLVTEGLEPGKESEDVVTFLTNALEVAQSGGLPFD